MLALWIICACIRISISIQASGDVGPFELSFELPLVPEALPEALDVELLEVDAAASPGAVTVTFVPSE